MEQEKKGASVFWRENTAEAINLIKNETKLLIPNFNWEYNNNFSMISKFLNRIFNAKKLRNTTEIKIVTDMVRIEDGSLVYNAGANLIKNLREFGFNGQIIVFTGDEKKALENCQSIGAYDPQKVIITNKTNILTKNLF